MKAKKLLLTVSGALLLSFLSGPTAAAQDRIPTVEFSYSYVPFDRTCSALADFEIEEAWIEELASKIDTFRQVWAEHGPPLLEATVEATGVPFRQRDMLAVMTLCKIPSMSHPLLLNVRRYLDAATEGEPRDLHFFVALVFHELLHTYVYENLDEFTLLEKYEDEPFSVKSHVHLMALMKHAYLKSRQEDMLQDIIELDGRIGPIYARAWEIVNEEEDYRAFVAELKR